MTTLLCRQCCRLKKLNRNSSCFLILGVFYTSSSGYDKVPDSFYDMFFVITVTHIPITVKNIHQCRAELMGRQHARPLCIVGCVPMFRKKRLAGDDHDRPLKLWHELNKFELRSSTRSVTENL